MATDIGPSALRIRIDVRALGNPLPLGLFSFGSGMPLLAAQSAGWVPGDGFRELGLLIACLAFPLERVATIRAFWRVTRWPPPSSAISFILSLSATRALLSGLYEVTSTKGLQTAAGIVTAVGGVAWYAGTAFTSEDIRRKP